MDVSGKVVKLVETNNQSGQYVALSHCWGDSRPPCLTTRSTKERNMREITWLSLPNTFRDAIEVTRELNIQFLWIDSLCIVQDDDDDWRQESSKMASVYQNSYLTICATASQSDAIGLWDRVPTNILKKAIVQHSGKQYEVYFRDLYKTRILHADTQHEVSLASNQALAPLTLRGWALQEYLLSRRLLHYGHGELLWECQERATCECCFSMTRDSPYMDLTRELFNVISDMQNSSSIDKVANCWRLLIARYSKLSLTMSKDRLPAVSALAKVCSTARDGDRYLAGLWENSFIDDMCWRHVGVKTCRPEKWRAPSWSWASIDGRINYFFAASENTAYSRLVRATTQLAGSDFTGEILSAYVVLKGPIRALQVTRVYEDNFEVVIESSTVNCYVDSHTEILRGLVKVGTTIFCLRLRSFFAADLVVTLVEVDGKPNVYQRVGIVEMRTTDTNQYWVGEETQDMEIKII